MTASSAMDQPADRANAFGAVIALKPAHEAKSRLGTLPDPLRHRLAWTMAVDTLTAVTSAVGPVVVVSNQSGLAALLRCYGLRPLVLPEQGPNGLNAALDFGASHLRSLGCASVLACVGDLPALSPPSLRRVLQTASTLERSFVSDAAGEGTTMLLSTHGALDPRFQGQSARAHSGSGAVELTDDRLGAALPDARRDVDSEADLAEASRLGLGRQTGALFDPDTKRLAEYCTITVAEPTEEGHLAITREGYRVLLPHEAVDPMLRTVRTGQRLHGVRGCSRVLAAWL